MITTRILICILSPIIYEVLHMICTSWKKDKGEWKTHVIVYTCITIFDYLLVFIYCKWFKWLFGVSIFSEQFDIIEKFSMLDASLSFILMAAIFSIIYANTRNEENSPFLHTLIMIIVLIFEIILISIFIRGEQDKYRFNQTEYIQTDKTVYLRALGDGHTTSGEIKGRTFIGTGYIDGEIKDNYVIYYAYDGENNEVIIDKIPYGQNTHIYEEGDDCIPRIEFHYYSKSYKDMHHEYIIYNIYIPSILNSINIDME